MDENEFPESFALLPRICYLSVADFTLSHRNEWHNTRRSDLIYVISGELTVLLPGELRFPAVPGEVLLMAGQLSHRDIFKPRKGLKALIVSYQWAGDEEFFAPWGGAQVRKFSPTQLRDVHWQLERIREGVDAARRRGGDFMLAESRLHTVLLLLYHLSIHKQAGAAETARGYRPEELLREAKNYICRNYSSPGLSRAETAAALSVSVPTLSRAFERCSGYTFLEYLIEVRLEAARRLLRDEHCRVGEAALRCGFSDPGYFARVFKKAFGVSPGRFR